MAGPTDATRRARKLARPNLLYRLAAARSPVPCPRCGLPMTLDQALHVGHTVDVVDGGAGSPLRLEHASCNQRAGDRRRGRNRSSQPSPSRQLSRAEQREQDRMKKINEREVKRQRRMIMPTRVESWEL